MSFRSAELSSSEAYLRFGSNCRLRGLEFPVIPPHIATGKDKPWFLIHLSITFTCSSILVDISKNAPFDCSLNI
ncbi:hypothetical protein HanOQP8_Chr06g0228501 [Helianthus annuus]|uniref:Uncharacterized protein n=1 Tax=Helianthus annuus TaxID=4232 RepID=A0A251VLE6_HELAN|nr:hypothetical protein HanOQP8_Chr06g0228501 [Helianthus annuus]